jgi:lipopolysaccharide export system protein LptA
MTSDFTLKIANHRRHIIILRLIFFVVLVYTLPHTSNLLAQDKIKLNHADSLVGKTINGEQVREAYGNVSLTQNNVNITCGRVIQYFDQNKAELFGSVRVVKDTLTISAPAGIYYGNESKIICPSGVVLTDPKSTVKANYGTYYFTQDLASFRGNVNITDSRSYTITSDDLDYYRSVQKSYGRGNVKIVSDSSTIYCDSLIYEKLIGFSTATGNVKIESDSTVITSSKATYDEIQKKSIAENNVKIDFLNKNAVVYGDYSENYEKSNYSLIKGNSRLIQIEKKEIDYDTTFIFSKKMESFRNRPEYYIATDSVRTIRNDFSSASKIGYYFRNESGKGGVISLAKDPVVWKDRSQVSGDTIFAYFRDDIDDIFVRKSAIAIDFNDDYPERYNQISGVYMHMKFYDNEINYIEVDTSASSIYFIYESDNSPNGANKAEGDVIILEFKNKKVEKVKLYGKPNGSYIPENLLTPSELRLMGFRIRGEKPVRFQ